jgi:hypothetical protein
MSYNIYVTHTDRKMLDSMMGNAMLADDICAHLLRQDRRELVLRSYRFSSTVDRFVRSLPDMPDLQALAQELEILFMLRREEESRRRRTLQ